MKYDTGTYIRYKDNYLIKICSFITKIGGDNIYKVIYKVNYINIETKNYVINSSYHHKITDLIEEKITQEEIDWLEYCELHNDFVDKETALKLSEPRQLREFIKENNLV